MHSRKLNSALLKKCLRYAVLAALCVLMAVAVVNLYMINRAKGRIFTSTSAICANECGLVLGTDHPDGIRRRCKAAAALLADGKINWILVSGHPNNRGFSEPLGMKKVLEEMGVPPKSLHMDFNGNRTLNSMKTAASEFHLARLTIVTDDYHMARALFLADEMGIESVGFTPDTSASTLSYPWPRLREQLARFKAFFEGAFLKTST